MKLKKYIKDNFFILFLCIFSIFLFFYRLDYNTLASWDEAWYGSIAKNIVKTGDFIDTSYNGKPYYDHPPMGFWLMAFSDKIFGVNEFATRFPSALLGVLSIFLIYKIGVMLFKSKAVGFISALILETSVWYVIRVRSGNLESDFLFFYLLTVYLAIKSSKNFKYFPLVGLSFACLMLTKTLAGLSVLVLIVFLDFKQMIDIKKNFIWLSAGVVVFFLVVFPWYNFHEHKYPGFNDYHFKHIGERDQKSSIYPVNAKEVLFYVHMGITKWYKPWELSIALTPILLGYYLITFIISKNKKNNQKIKSYIFLGLWTMVVLYPFLTSFQTEIWHLIPTYPPIALLTAALSYDFCSIAINIFKKSKFKNVILILYIGSFLTIGFIQVKNYRFDVIPGNRYTPDEVDISKKLSKYSQKIFVDSDYLPIAVFYSGKHIDSLVLESNDVDTFKSLFSLNNGNVVGVTRNWVFADLKKKNFPYKLLEKNNTYSIVTKP